MKIALLHYSSPPIVGGVESVLAHHARLMTEAGHQVTIFAGRGSALGPKIPFCQIPEADSRHAEVLAVKAELDAGTVSPRFNTLVDRLLAVLGRELKGFDYLIAHNVATLHKNLALTAALFALHQQPGYPELILWHHDLAWTTPRYRAEMHEGFPWQLLRQPWPGVTNVVISEQRRHELAELLGLDPAGIQVIPNGVDLHSFYKLEPQTIELAHSLGLFDADPLLLLPVRLTTRKNIELALHVTAALANEFPQAMLLVTGPEGPHNPANRQYRQKLLDLRDALSLQGRAIFMAEVTAEFLPDEIIADFYRLADALLFPSREEGFGIPLIEAGFSNIPAFCADIPVLRELGGEDVNYFDPDGNSVEIAAQIAAVLNSESTQRWARKAKHGYTWRAIYRDAIEPLFRVRKE